RGTAAVAGGVESSSARLEEQLRRARLEGRAAGFHLDRHELPPVRVEQLFPVVTPFRHGAAARRNLPLAARRGEALHVHLACSRFIRRVRYPPTVGGELCALFGERRLEKRERLPVSVERQNPDV